jgi:hypothetical protein
MRKEVQNERETERDPERHFIIPEFGMAVIVS